MSEACTNYEGEGIHFSRERTSKRCGRLLKTNASRVPVFYLHRLRRLAHTMYSVQFQQRMSNGKNYIVSCLKQSPSNTTWQEQLQLFSTNLIERPAIAAYWFQTAGKYSSGMCCSRSSKARVIGGGTNGNFEALV